MTELDTVGLSLGHMTKCGGEPQARRWLLAEDAADLQPSVVETHDRGQGAIGDSESSESSESGERRESGCAEAGNELDSMSGLMRRGVVTRMVTEPRAVWVWLSADHDWREWAPRIHAALRDARIVSLGQSDSLAMKSAHDSEASADSSGDSSASSSRDSLAGSSGDSPAGSAGDSSAGSPGGCGSSTTSTVSVLIAVPAEDEVLRHIALDVVHGQLAPYLASHGGEVTVGDVRDGAVTVTFGGACGHCPLSDVTLHLRIEGALRERFPMLGEVRDVTSRAHPGLFAGLFGKRSR